MLRIFYNKDKDAPTWHWKIFDPELSKMFKGKHVNITIPCQTEERCKVGLCAAYCIVAEGKVIEEDNGTLTVVAKE